jgi:hypothetical protein
LSYTEDFTNNFWTKNAISITANTTTAPDGTTTADTLSDGLTNNAHYINTPVSLGINGNNTLSIYAKANTLNFLWIYFYNGVEPAGPAAWFNLSNGTIGTVYSGITANIENAGNGWYRCSITRNFNFTASFSNCGFGVSNADNVVSYLGTNKSLFVWGPQLDAGLTPTTYQPIATTQQAFIASQFKFNLKDPRDLDAAFRLVFNGGWTHSSTGATPNGTNGYADTKFNNQGNWTATSNGSIGVNIATNPTAGIQCDMGSGNGADGSNSSIIYSRFVGDVYYAGLNCTSVILGNANTSSIGLFVTSRLNTTQHSLYKRGSSTINSTATNAIGGNPNRTFYIGAANSTVTGNASNYSDRRYNYSFIGDGLTQSEVDLYYARITTFNTALSR